MRQFSLLQGSKALDQIKKKNQPKESSAVEVEVKDHVSWLQRTSWAWVDGKNCVMFNQIAVQKRPKTSHALFISTAEKQGFSTFATNGTTRKLSGVPA